MKNWAVAAFTLLIIGSLSAQSNSSNKNSDDSSTIKPIYTNPEFPGGDSALMQFLQKNIHYPEAERMKRMEGKVLVRFLLDEQGFLAEVKITKSVSPGLDSEAVRVVKLLPRFKPGYLQGLPTKVFYNLPVVFKLTDSRSPEDKLITEKLNKDKYYKSAIEFGEKGLYAKALKKINKSISSFPNEYLGYEFLGICHVQLGEIDEACRDFSRAQALGSVNATRILKEHCQ
jgi:TonB family protein